VLTALGMRFPEVRIDSSTLPFDAAGNRTGVQDPLAVHTWMTSSKRAAETPK